MSTTGGHRGEVIAEIEQRRAELNIGLLKIYNYYRVTVGFALDGSARAGSAAEPARQS